MLHGLVDRYQHFGGTYCLHLQGWFLPASAHGVTTQKVNCGIIMRKANISVFTSNGEFILLCSMSQYVVSLTVTPCSLKATRFSPSHSQKMVYINLLAKVIL
jgi:hypothetical protein